MIITWSVVVLLVVGVAALLAMADGALLAAGHIGPRKFIPNPERAHLALLRARVIAHLVIGTGIALVTSSVISHTVLAMGVAALLVLASVTAVEAMARFAGLARGMEAVERLALVVRIADALMLPVTALSEAIEGLLARALPPADGTSVQRDADAEQFREVVTTEAGVTGPEEDILHGVFSLADTQAQEIMVPRVDMVGIEKSIPWSELLDRVRSSEHARFPVFDDTLDNILGILYAKDLLPPIVADTEPADWTTLVRPAAFIPATKAIDQQLRDFKAQRTHIALVMDEYGGIAGLVTIEDILEVIVGDIRDEYDEEEAAIEQEGGQRFWVSGIVTLADLSELLGENFQREDLTTVGGLVYEAFGRVPRAGESRTVNGFKLVVERVSRRRIHRVYFERLSEPGAT